MVESREKQWKHHRSCYWSLEPFDHRPTRPEAGLRLDDNERERCVAVQNPWWDSRKSKEVLFESQMEQENTTPGANDLLSLVITGPSARYCRIEAESTV